MPFLVFLVLVIVEMLPSESDAARVVTAGNNSAAKGKRVGDMEQSLKMKRGLNGTKVRGLTKERVHAWFKLVIPCATAVFSLGYFIVVVCIIAINENEFKA